MTDHIDSRRHDQLDGSTDAKIYNRDRQDYQALIEQRKFKEAAEVLKKEIESHADDMKLRSLAYCYLHLEDAISTIATIQQIAQLTYSDYFMLGLGYWQMQNWDEMAVAFKASSQLHSSAQVYHYLSVAEAKGRKTYDLDAASRQLMQAHLLQAIQHGDCSEGDFLWLADLYGYQELERKVSILEMALLRFPQSFVVRLEFASTYLYQLNAYDRTLDVINPIFDSDIAIPEEAKWYKFSALEGLGKYVEALECLESMEKSDRSEIMRVRANLLFKQSKFAEWLIYSEQVPDEDSTRLFIKKTFRKAYINLQAGELNQGVQDFIEGATRILDYRGYDLHNQVYLGIGNEVFVYEEFDVILDVCESLLLLRDNNEVITNEVLGLIACVIYKVYQSMGDSKEELKELLNSEVMDWLLLADKLLKSPPSLGEELCWHYLKIDAPKAINHHLAFCLWAHRQGVQFEPEISEYAHHGHEQEIEDQIASKRTAIHEVAISYLNLCDDLEEIRKIFVPFYNQFWRKILFDGKTFSAVVSVTKKFLDRLGSSDGLFDYAYSLNELGKFDEAEQAYQRLLAIEHNNHAVLNNLGVIYEQKGQIEEALKYFSQAADLSPSKTLYINNRNRVNNKLEFFQTSRLKAELALQKLTEKASDLGITAEQQREMSELYWGGQLSVKEIQLKFGTNNIYGVIIPKPSGEKCPNCSVDLVYKSRTGLESGEKVCLGCGHKSQGWCHCDYCRRIQEERRKREVEARKQAANEEFRKLQERYCTTDYAEWATSQLNRKQKEFLKAFIETTESEDNPTWLKICERAGVVSEKIYVERLKSLKLLLTQPDGEIISNSAVEIEMLHIENVRKISKSLRFEVFQRDKHTCQYCGRTTPHVILEVDHLIPVAKGGTDDFDNLVTSCEDCNAGKSDKLINEFTGGFGKDEWREQIRELRLAALRERRERISEVSTHWQECLGRKYLKEHDNEAIHIFVERYDPEWIKAAISIAAKKKIADYVKYTGGILRNWAKDGPPEYLSDPESGLAKRPATEKQINFIRTLLGSLGVELGEFYSKSDYDGLSMLDARNLIKALTEKDQHDDE